MPKQIKVIILLIMISLFGNKLSANYEKLAYDFQFKDLDGSPLNLSEYKDKVIVVVNVASQCGFTKQYEDMQNVWEKYQARGFVMLGVPSNDFGNQEPGNSKDIKNFCEAKFGISFPMTEKVSVKGENAHPLYKWAKENYGSSAIPKWNFHKIIIGKDGRIEDTFASITNPSSKRFIKAIEKALDKI
jgi:glutathione peroxidase